MKDYLKPGLFAFILVALLSCDFGRKAQSHKARLEGMEESKATPEKKAEKAEAKVINIKAEDYNYSGVPDTIPAGYITFHVDNQGDFPHNAGLVRIKDGHSYEDLINGLKNSKEGQAPPDWAKEVGGPTAPLAGKSSEATLELKPGTYALVCGIPVPSGIPHFMKGMTKKITVVDTEAEVTAPQADVKMVLDDYSFDMDHDIGPGRKTIKVTNVADQPHEFLLVRLNEGKTAGDMLDWLGQVMGAEKAPLAEAPGEFLNGVSPMQKGVANYITANFTPGDYCLICAYPDVKDARPHFMHGMVKQFSVSENEVAQAE